jgi:myosin heavy subunit
MKSPELRSENSGPSQKSNYKNVLIGFLGLAIVAMFVFLMIDRGGPKESSKEAVYQDAPADMTAEEEVVLRKNFDEALARVDSLNAANDNLNKELTTKNEEINKAKEEIRGILNSKKITASELSKARTLIDSLNEKIASMEQEMNTLRQDNETLRQEKEVLTQQNTKLNEDLTVANDLNTQLTAKVDVGSTLNASNFRITPLKVKNDKVKETYKAKRVDKMVLSFDVSNRIAETGTKDVYVIVTAPDGQMISSDNLGSGSFTTREGDKMFTTKVAVDVETAKTKQVEFALKQDSKFVPGTYRFQIYQNGFLIGEGKYRSRTSDNTRLI